MNNKITITFISDTHTYLGTILDKIPNSDLLIHCGDALSRGSIEEFGRFCRTLFNIHKRFNKILYTPGNHDKCTQQDLNLCREMFTIDVPNGEMLVDESFNYKGLKFYGSPWTPEFFYWSWMYDKKNAKSIWEKIPSDIDILFTHGMPHGIMDEVQILIGEEVDPHVGCKELRNEIKRVRPTIYCGGHLHFSGGKIMQEDGTLFINAAICDEQYMPNRLPITIEIDTETKEWKIL